MRHRPRGGAQLAEMGAHGYAAESRRRGIDSQHGTENLDVRAGAPRVAIRARWAVRPVHRFSERGQPAGEHVAPRTELTQVTVAFADLCQCTVNVVLEEQPGLGQTRHGW